MTRCLVTIVYLLWIGAAWRLTSNVKAQLTHDCPGRRLGNWCVFLGSLTSPQTRQEAENQCNRQQGNLLVINDTTKQDFIERLMKELHGGRDCYCGNSFANAGHVMTTGCNIQCNGDTQVNCGGFRKNNIYILNGTYGKWARDQPNNFRGNQFCGVMDASHWGKFADDVCEKEMLYICDMPTTRCQLNSSVNEDNLNYVVAGGHCYYVSVVALIWVAARMDCIEKGGDLAKVDSADVHRTLTDMFSSETRWIGLTRVELKWRSGSDMTYSNWADQCPNKYTDQCVKLDASDSYKWRDAECTEQMSFFCEKEVADDLTTETPSTTTTSTSASVTTTATPSRTTATTPPAVTTTTTPSRTTAITPPAVTTTATPSRTTAITHPAVTTTVTPSRTTAITPPVVTTTATPSRTTTTTYPAMTTTETVQLPLTSAISTTTANSKATKTSTTTTTTMTTRTTNNVTSPLVVTRPPTRRSPVTKIVTSTTIATTTSSPRNDTVKIPATGATTDTNSKTAGFMIGLIVVSCLLLVALVILAATCIVKHRTSKNQRLVCPETDSEDNASRLAFTPNGIFGKMSG
ncbi:hypothetical protein LSAT2_013927 [Lamellibrachia satsuma]|nr:hypothetical protein LSAT2_013927 [Lamellibrachia satsuma]